MTCPSTPSTVSDAWVHGRDVTREDFGTAESTVDRIAAIWDRQEVSTTEIAAKLKVSLTLASNSAARLAKKGGARRIKLNLWHIGFERRG